jgi:hypothetical protein
MQASTKAADVLNAEFPEIRARLLQIAAQLDRLDRAPDKLASEPRLEGIRRAIETLSQPGPGRAEKIQLIFSLPYESEWKEKFKLSR